MDSCLGRVIDTSNCHGHSLDCLLLTIFFHLDIADLNLINSQAVDSLSGPFNEGSFLHQELIGLVPEFTFVHLNAHPDAFFLEPQLILTLSQAADLHIVNPMLISLIHNQFGLANLVADVGATRLADLNELEISRLDRAVLERQSHLLLSQDGE